MIGGNKLSPGILFVLPWPIRAIGGVNQVVENLIHQARRTKTVRPLLLEYSTGHTKPDLVADAAATPVIRLRVPVPFALPGALRSALSFLWHLPHTLRSLHHILREHRVVLVNAHYPTLAALHFGILKVIRAYRGKVVLSFHGLDIRNATTTRGLERLAWRCLLHCADSIVTCSQSLGAELISFEPASRKRLTVIHNGVDPEKLLTPHTHPLRPTLTGDEIYILNVGTFEHKKGQDVLLEAFRQLAPENPALHLVLIGRSTPYLAVLTERVARLGLQDRVQFHADIPHTEIGPFFANAAVFCLPSRIEPFGIVILEAAVFGIPVVATAVGGVTEIVRQGVDGTLVPPDDPAALFLALRAALTAGGAGSRHAASLKARVLRDFTWHNALRKYLELI